MSAAEPRARRTSPREITAEVLSRYEACPDPRLREIMQSLVGHLHGFVADVRLSEEEWAGAIRMLTATGHITDERRQEFILFSDTIGVSMLVDALANQLPEGATESTVLGPFYVPGSPLREYGANIAEEEAGVPAWIYGRILSVGGEPLAGAELDVWQNGDNRLYAVQDPNAPARTARLRSSRCARSRTRSPSTGPWARCSTRPLVTPGAPPTST